MKRFLGPGSLGFAAYTTVAVLLLVSCEHKQLGSNSPTKGAPVAGKEAPAVASAAPQPQPAPPPPAQAPPAPPPPAPPALDLKPLEAKLDKPSSDANDAKNAVASLATSVNDGFSRLSGTLPAFQNQMDDVNSNLKRLERIIVQQNVARKAAANAKGPIDDYVPCELTPQQTLENKFQEAPPTDIPSAVDHLNASGIRVDKEKLTNALSRYAHSASAIRLAVNDLANDDGIIARPNQEMEDAKTEVTTAIAGTVAAITAPQDVACSMVMMPWQVTADSFGPHVADQFIAFQVIVRNLNGTQEFLMHNVAIAIEDQRFYSGMDKLIVRNSQAHGQAYDRRNFAMRALEVAGDIAAGAAPFGSGDIQAGIGVFRSAFVPGMGKLFPDRYFNQINALNDLGFSSSMAYKIVIPIKGSAPFVTFLPADIFSRKIASSPPPAVPNTKAGTTKTKTPAKKDWHYKYWSADQLHVFIEKTYVIAAGIHVQEVHNDQPSITTMTCNGATGALDASKPDTAGGKTLTCAVTGQNLDKVSVIRLKNALDSNDTKIADAKVTLAGGQSTSGQAVFQVSDLLGLTGTSYGVFVVTGANKTELPTTQTIAVSATSTTATLNIAVGSSGCSVSDCSGTVAGTNLGQAKQYVLQNPTGKLMDSGPVSVATDNSGVTVRFTNLKGVAAGDYQLILQTAGTNIAKIPVKLTVTAPTQ